MLLAVAFTHSTTGLLHQRGLMVEMGPHEFLQPCHEKCKLDWLARDRLKPPIRNCLMVSIDDFMTQCVLSSN